MDALIHILLNADTHTPPEHLPEKDRCIIMHMPCVHRYQPETTKEWKPLTSPAKKKAKLVPSAVNVMASVLWHSKGILLVEYRPLMARPTSKGIWC